MPQKNKGSQQENGPAIQQSQQTNRNVGQNQSMNPQKKTTTAGK